MAFIAVTILSNTVNATIWRVNNNSNFDGSTNWGENYGGSGTFPVFKEINDAVASALVDDNIGDIDTLHVEGSALFYSNATITKPLVIIGAGYFLSNNPKTSNSGLETKIHYIQLNPGSSGSTIMGFNVIGASGSNGTIYVGSGLTNITIKRCRIEANIGLSNFNNDIYIVQNYFSSTISNSALANNNLGSPPSNIYFNNNICQKPFLWGYNGNPYNLTECNNNIFDGPDNLATPSLSFNTNVFMNNIIMGTNAILNINAPVGSIDYNIGSLNSQFSGGLLNNQVISISSIPNLFTTSTSPDGQYQLSATSAALGTGFNGVDVGAFGGPSQTNQYVLSGNAAIPVIYDVYTSGTATQQSGLPVTIKARTIK